MAEELVAKRSMTRRSSFSYSSLSEFIQQLQALDVREGCLGVERDTVVVDRKGHARLAKENMEASLLGEDGVPGVASLIAAPLVSSKLSPSWVLPHQRGP